MSVRIYAAIFGILFLIIGILGFLPQFSPNGVFLNFFTLNVMHNVFHIITGLIGLFVSLVSPHASRVFFKIFGSIYLFVAVLALMLGGDLVFLKLNTADNLFHLIIGAIFVYLGFGKPREKEVFTTKTYNGVSTEDNGRVETRKVETRRTDDKVVHVDLADKKSEDKKMND